MSALGKRHSGLYQTLHYVNLKPKYVTSPQEPVRYTYITIGKINIVPHQDAQRFHVFWIWKIFNEVQVIL